MQYPQQYAILKGLKPNEFSEPFDVKDHEVHVVQLVKEETPAQGKTGKPADQSTQYQLRDFKFASEALARQALPSLQNPATFQKGVALAVNMSSAEQVERASAKDLQSQFPAIAAALNSLQPNEFSAPITITLDRGFHVLQLVKEEPAEKASFENRGGWIGQQLLQANQQKYAMAFEEMKAKALHDVDVQFISDETKNIHDMWTKMMTENPNVGNSSANPGAQGMPGTSGAPGAPGAPGMPHIRMAPPSAQPGAGGSETTSAATRAINRARMTDEPAGPSAGSVNHQGTTEWVVCHEQQQHFLISQLKLSLPFPTTLSYQTWQMVEEMKQGDDSESQ